MKPLPQLERRTGISRDYANEMIQLPEYLRVFGREKFMETLHRKPVRAYEQRFPPHEFVEVITPENQDTVLRLNSLAEKINRMVSSGKVEEEEISAAAREARELIFGNGAAQVA